MGSVGVYKEIKARVVVEWWWSGAAKWDAVVCATTTLWGNKNLLLTSDYMPHTSPPPPSTRLTRLVHSRNSFPAGCAVSSVELSGCQRLGGTCYSDVTCFRFGSPQQQQPYHTPYNWLPHDFSFSSVIRSRRAARLNGATNDIAPQPTNAPQPIRRQSEL